MALLLLVALVQPSCTVSHTVEGPRHTLTVTALDEAWLLRNAAFADEQFSRSGLLINDRDLQGFFNDVLRRLLVARGSTGARIRVRGIRDKEVNAFALPNGSIYFNSGLISLLENEDQFAAVLAHEVEHVLGRHTVRDTRVNVLQVVLLAIGLSALESAADRPTDLESNLQFANIFATRAYSRRLEKKADLSSVRTLDKAGYDPGAMEAALRRIREADRSRNSRVLVWNAEHPAMKDRIRYCRHEAEAVRSAPRIAPTQGGEDRYRSLVAAVLPDVG